MILYALCVQPFEYRFASFTVPDPHRSAAFFQRYTGASHVPKSQWMAYKDTDSAQVAAVRLHFDSKYTDVYFWKKINDSTESITFSRYLEATHTFAPDDWNWWQDWHAAFFTSDVDAVAIRLSEDKIPFVNLGGGLYFMVPGGITIQVVGPPMKLFWSVRAFEFCRKTDDITAAMRPYPLNLTDLTGKHASIQQFYPSHHSFATTMPVEIMQYVTSLLDFQKMDMDKISRPGQSHAYMHGQCAFVEWVFLRGSKFSLHFLHQYHKREGHLRVADHERKLIGSRHTLMHQDAFFGTRLGFAVDSLDRLQQYVDRLRESNTTYHVQLAKGRLLLMLPNGYLFELFVDDALSLESNSVGVNLTPHPYGGLVPHYVVQDSNRVMAWPLFATTLPLLVYAFSLRNTRYLI